MMRPCICARHQAPPSAVADPSTEIVLADVVEIAATVRRFAGDIRWRWFEHASGGMRASFERYGHLSVAYVQFDNPPVTLLAQGACPPVRSWL